MSRERLRLNGLLRSNSAQALPASEARRGSRCAGLFFAWGSLPVIDVDQFPRAADEVHLQRALLVDHQLRGGIEDALLLDLSFIVQIRSRRR